MLKMKKTSGLIAIIILLSIAVSAFSVQAATPRTVYGKVYIDGELVTDGTTVKLIFTGQEITNDTYDNGNYVMNFIEDNWATGTFLVYYNGDWQSTSPLTVGLEGEDVIHYPLDLNIILTANNPPNAPTLVAPSDGSTIGGKTSASLQVSVSDPNGDSMEVKFYNANGDALIGTVTGISSGATASKTWSGLSEETTYSWYATAYDGEYTTPSATWSFTTGSGGSPPSPPGPPGPPSPPPSNQPPSADANGPYFEFKNKLLGYAEVSFDGSGSSGTISTYKWDFGDGTTGTGKNPTHKYTSDGNYTVILNVTGPLGYDIDNTYALISLGPNIPPTPPIITGPQTGTKNTDYDYIAVSTDEDNDQLKYTFNWDDATSITTDFVPNATAVTEPHNWFEAGVYTINVKASDNQSETSADYVVLIDAIWVKDIGYLLDTDGDGTYDSFYSNETGDTTDSEKQEDGTYLINSDDDSGWDWIYDPDTDTLTEYSEAEPETTEGDNSLWYAVGILVIILVVGIILFAGRKKEKKGKKGKKPKK